MLNLEYLKLNGVFTLWEDRQLDYLVQIPYTVAAELLLTGKHISAREAKDIGLIGHVVPDGKALEKAQEIAETISKMDHLL